MSEFHTRLNSVPSGGFLTDRDKDKSLFWMSVSWASILAA